MASGADERELISLLKYGRRLGNEGKFDEALAVAEELLTRIREEGASAQLQSEAWGLKSVVLFRLEREEDALAPGQSAHARLRHAGTKERLRILCVISRTRRTLDQSCRLVRHLPLLRHHARLASPVAPSISNCHAVVAQCRTFV